MSYDISTDPERLDLDVIHHYLARESYWATHVPRDRLERAIAHSLCFAAYAGDALVAFARVVTDRATFAYLCDVFVLESHRGYGLGQTLLRAIHAHPELQGLRRWMLVTKDAHGLYAKLGWTAPADPARVMEILRPYPAGSPM